MKKEKTFDFLDLPEEIKEELQERWSSYPPYNGSYKKLYIQGEQKPRSEYKGGEILHVDESCDYIVERGDDIVSDYFQDNYKCKRLDEILLKISW